MDAGMARYMAIWAVTLTVMLGAVATLCAIVDPYNVIGTPCIPGLTAQKPAAVHWARLSKAYLIQRQQPMTLILGSSSADVGFNPESPAWPASAKPVFNLAIDGAGPDVFLRYLQHALAATTPRHIVVAVNFIESLTLPPRRVTEAAAQPFDFESRMRVLATGAPNPAYARAHVADLVFATLSLTALSDSVTTLLHQHDPSTAYETASGWNDGGELRRWARADGFFRLVIDKDREKIAQYKTWRAQKSLQIDPVLRLVRLARAHGADVTLVIPPNYVDTMESLRQLGLDPDYDAWKSAIVTGGTAVGATVWDFSGYSPYTTEPLPASTDRTHRLRWIWEPVHFQSALGDVMIARITGAPGDFGAILTPANLASQIARYHAGQTNWIGQHPADIARISALVR
jgi:hypothetical protein